MTKSNTVLKNNPPSVPPFRFKEFKEIWSERQLKDVLTLVTRPIKMKDEKTYSLVTVKRRYGGIVHRGNYKGKEVKVKSQFLLEENDFLISKRQISHNACGLVPKKLVGSIVSNEYSVFNPQENLDIHFFNYFCLLPKVSRTFFLSSTGVHIEKMIFKVDDWVKRKFYFPSLPEQKKIATFLSAIDKKIQQLTRKKALLEEYKKGLMQQLFSGALRFRPAQQNDGDEEGKDYPAWEEKRLGEVLTIGSGKDYKHLGKGNIPVFGTGGYMLSVDKMLHDGETVFIGRKGTINKPFYFKGPFWTVDTLFYTHKFKSVIPGFIYVIFQQINWKLYNEASGVPSLSKSTIENIKSRFPCIEEQTKITRIFSTIDTKIKTITTQINKTQTFKKGLLQQMFV